MITIKNPLSVIIQQTQAGGKKFTKGEVTFATDSKNQVITHNLGTVPSIFLLYPKDISTFPEGGTAENKGLCSGYLNATKQAGVALRLARQGNSNTGAIGWSLVAETSLTETTATTNAGSGGYYFKPGYEFAWIAIE